jgi:hypothetical protein
LGGDGLAPSRHSTFSALEICIPFKMVGIPLGISIMSDLVALMNEPLQSETQGPGVLIIRLVSLLTTMKDKIQTLERDAQRSRLSESEMCAKLSNASAAQIKEASEAQKENTNCKDMQMRQNVIPILKLQIQSLTSKTQCDALDIKQLILEKEQLTKDLAVLKHQVLVQRFKLFIQLRDVYMQMLDMVPKSVEKDEEHPESVARRKESEIICAMIYNY